MAKRRSSLRVRFVFGMAIMLVPLVGLAVAAYTSLHSALEALNEVIAVNDALLGPAQELQILVQKTTKPVYEFLAGSGSQECTGRFTSLAARVDDTFRKLSASMIHQQSGNRLQLYYARDHWNRAKEAGRKLLAKENPALERAELKPRLDTLHSESESTLQYLARIHDSLGMEIAYKRIMAHSVRELVLFKLGVIFLVGMGVAGFGGMMLARSVLQPLRKLEEGVNMLGEGKLDYRVALQTRDELEHLGRAFNTMAEKLERTQRTLEDLSIHDSLTGLCNYREFHRWLGREVGRSRRYGRPFSLLMIDIDHFKKVNDTYGHQAGDEVLRSLAETLQNGVREIDKVARCGGEEFAIILPEIPAEKAMVVAERIRESVQAEGIPLPGGDFASITVSVGVASFTEDADTGNKLVGAADEACYAAKRKGRNRVCHSGQHDEPGGTS